MFNIELNISRGLLAPAARDMRHEDILHQYMHVNCLTHAEALAELA